MSTLTNLTLVQKQAASIALSFYQDQALSTPFDLTGYSLELEVEPLFGPARVFTDGSGLSVSYSAGTATLAIPATALPSPGGGRWRLRVLNAGGTVVFDSTGLIQVFVQGSASTAASVALLGVLAQGSASSTATAKSRDRSRVAAAFPPALAAPPSVVLGASNAATSIASGTDHPTFPSGVLSSDFTFYGRQFANGGQDATACQIGPGTSSGFGAPHVLQSAFPTFGGGAGHTRMEFGTDATQLEVVGRGNGVPITIFVNDQFLGVYDMPGGSGANRIYIGGTTPLSGRNTIRVEGSGASIRAVRVPVGAGVWPVNLGGPKMVIVGDSFIVASVLTDADRAAAGGFAQQVGYALGVPNTVCQGIAGTGLLSTNGGTKPTYRQRIGDLTAEAPDIVWIWGSINDFGQTAAAIQAELTTYLAAIKSALPKALVIATAPPDMVGSGANGLNVANVENGMSPACSAASVPYSALRIDAPMTGTGHVGATAGNGNRDFYTGSDDLHPAGAGMAYIGRRAAVVLEGFLASSKWA
jgi:lysophospholipase L1-like esterase